MNKPHYSSAHPKIPQAPGPTADAFEGLPSAPRQRPEPASRWTGLNFAGDVTSVFVSQVVIMVIGLAGSIITARVLGPAGRGVLSLVTLWILLLAIAVPFSCGYGMIYYIRQARLTFGEALSATLGLSITFGLLAIGVSLLGAAVWRHGLLRDVPFSYIALASLSLPAAIFTGISSLVMIGAGRIKQNSIIIAVISPLALMLLCIFIFLLHLGVGGAIAASALSSVLGAIIIIIWFWSELHWRSLFAPANWLPALHFGSKVHGGTVAQLANFSLDRFLINLYLGPSAVGIYSISALLAEKLWVLPGAMGTALYPRTGGGAEADGALTARVCRNTLWLMIGVCLLIGILAPWLVINLFGSRFSPGVVPLLILLPGVLFFSVGKVLIPYIQNRGNPLFMTYIPLGSLLLTLGLNFLLIPRLGIIGSALASTVAYTLYGLAFTVVFVRLSGRSLTQLIRFPLEDFRLALKLGKAKFRRNRESTAGFQAASEIVRR